MQGRSRIIQKGKRAEAHSVPAGAMPRTPCERVEGPSARARVQLQQDDGISGLLQHVQRRAERGCASFSSLQASPPFYDSAIILDSDFISAEDRDRYDLRPDAAGGRAPLRISARCGRRNVLLTAGETQSGSTRPAVTHKGPDEPALAPTMRRLRQGAWSSISCGVLDPIASLAAPPMPRRANPKSTGRESAWRLTRGQRALCRALRAHKWKLPKLVRKFNCSQRTISRVFANTYGDVLSEGAHLSSVHGCLRFMTLHSRRRFH
jgi:hypothetical protein